MNDEIQLRLKQALTLGLFASLSSSIAILAVLTYHWQSKQNMFFMLR